MIKFLQSTFNLFSMPLILINYGGYQCLRGGSRMVAKSTVPSKLQLPSPNVTPYMRVTEKKAIRSTWNFALPGLCQTERNAQKVCGTI